MSRALLAWYDKSRRDLPWRQDRNPYRIWVSEIMLQQTQVKTVIPYFQRWVQTYPDMETLARAPLPRILKLWEGLGYYSRARNMHRAAKMVMQDHGGAFPESPEKILALPGIGRYTAGAIASIAFGHPLPVLDGNVKRVISRVHRLRENGATTRSATILWEAAASLVPRRRPGDFNQALMELGATVCLPQNPLCPVCPLRRLCLGAIHGEQDRLPPPKPKKPSRKIEVSAAVIQRGGRTFIQQRPRHGLMGGLWEFPGGKLETGESPETALNREIKEELGVEVTIREKLMTIRHAYTQFRVTLHVFRCALPRGRIRATQCEQWKWVRPGELEAFAFPAANAKVVQHLKGNGGAPPTSSPSKKGRS